jgi:hypothetical protein
VPDGTCTLDLSGRTVLPGFVMLHEHLSSGLAGSTTTSPQPFSSPGLYLAFGVTTIQTARTDHPHVELNLKRQVDPLLDIVLLMSAPRLRADDIVVLINGTPKPAAREMRVGERYRLRLINVHTSRPNVFMRLFRHGELTTWRPVAKDGRDLPTDQTALVPSGGADRERRDLRLRVRAGRRGAASVRDQGCGRCSSRVHAHRRAVSCVPGVGGDGLTKGPRRSVMLSAGWP